MDIDEQNKKIAAAKAVLEAKIAVCHETYDKLTKHLKTVLEKNIDTEYVNVSRVSTEYACLSMKDSNHTIDLHYLKPWGNEARKLDINFGCFGSFDKNDKHAIRYCEVLGHVAGIMAQLEHELLFTDEAKAMFAKHAHAADEVYAASREIEKLEHELKAYNDSVARDEILAKIKPGLKVVVKKATSWRSEIVKTIEHITAKNILFTENYGRRTPKDELVRNLLDGSWKIA